MSIYVGSRIIPKHCGDWDPEKEYETLSVVYHASTGDSYTSRKPVPAGIDIYNEEYWAISSKFEGVNSQYFGEDITEDDIDEIFEYVYEERAEHAASAGGEE